MQVEADWQLAHNKEPLAKEQALNRKVIAWMIDKYLHPFERPVNMHGQVQ